MGIFKDDSGKTEKATPQKLDQARDKGQAPVSREFTMAGTLLVAVLILQSFGWWLIEAFEAALESGMALGHRALEGGEIESVQHLLLEKFTMVAPPFFFLLVIFLLATALFGYSQIGLKIAKKALGIKFERLNPVTNLGKVFSLASVAKTALAVLKLFVIGGVLYLAMRAEWETYAKLQDIEQVAAAIGIVVDIALRAFVWISSVVLILSLADIAWQRYRHAKDLMMSKQEVDDERKRTDGDPLIKNRLRQARLELMKHRMMEAVPKASVVITNPTHFAVALRYDRTDNSSPELIAKGTDEVALKIREIAREHDIPIMEDPPLARALCRAVQVGQEIPERFFKAVATVLSHVYRLQGNVA